MRSRVASPAALRPRDRSSAESRAWGHANNTSRKQHLGGMPRFPAQDCCGKRLSSSRVAAAYRRLHTMSRGEIARVCGGHDVRRMVTPLALIVPLLSQPTIARIDADGRAGAYAPERTNLTELTTASLEQRSRRRAFIPSLQPARGFEGGQRTTAACVGPAECYATPRPRGCPALFEGRVLHAASLDR
ncbi:hypothetical protein ACVWW4_000719 [Bradyrhizobium sp. LB7.1]